MFKKTITYIDYNDVEKTEDFYFNLSRAEMIEMEMGAGGGLAEQLRAIVASKDVKKIGETFTDILKKSCGEKTVDGGFRKTPEITTKFLESEAYSEFLMEMISDSNVAAAFVSGIMPKKLPINK